MKHPRPDDSHVVHAHRRRRAWLTVLGNVVLHSFLLTVLVGAGWLLVQQVQVKEREVAAKQADVDTLQREIAVLDGRNQNLKYTVQYLKTDDGVEKVAREKLDLVKPGEVTFQVIPPTASATVAPPPPPPKPAPTPARTWFRQMLDAF